MNRNPGNSRPRLLLVDEDAEDRALTAVVLAGDLPAADVEQVGDGAGFVRAMAGGPFDLIVTSLQTSWARGVFLLREIRERQPRASIVVFTEEDDREAAVAAMRAGVADFLVKSPAGYLRLAKSARGALTAMPQATGTYATAFDAATAGTDQAAPPQRARGEGQADAVQMSSAVGVGAEDEILDALACGDSQPSMREIEIALDVMSSVLSDLREDSGQRSMRLTDRAAGTGSVAPRDRREEVNEIEILQRQREALVDKVAELERSNADLSEFAYIASHELQAPLRMVEKYSELVRMDVVGKAGPSVDESLGFLLDGARQMQGLVNDLLAFSRIGNAGDAIESCDCRKMAENAWATLEAAVDESGAELELGELPWVAGDESQLTQVFVNLLSNAIKFRSDRAPRIRMSGEQVDGQWQIAVRDNGIGIDPLDLDRIFQIFNRLHPERSGTGIGLALCKRIIERQGGQIWAESVPGEGATFFVSLPAWNSGESSEPRVVRFDTGSRRRAE